MSIRKPPGRGVGGTSRCRRKAREPLAEHVLVVDAVAKAGLADLHCTEQGAAPVCCPGTRDRTSAQQPLPAYECGHVVWVLQVG